MITVFGSRVGQDELEEVRTSLERQWIGMGPKTQLFEEQFAARLGLKNFLLVNSGSNALYLAIKLLNLPKGSEIILPSLTWISCATAIVLNGCTPIFCDVDLETQNVTAEMIAPKITVRTGAIMVVHYAGLPVNIQEVKGLGYFEHPIGWDIPVVEDAAHAVDSKIGSTYCGGIGDIGVYSFDGVKNLAIGEAGGITTRNSELAVRARQLRYCGIEKTGFEASTVKGRWWECNVVDHMFKMIPDDISASIGLAQLRRLDANQKYRKELWGIYQKELSSEAWLHLPKEPERDVQHSYFTYFIRLKTDKRDALAQYLYDNGIYTTLRYQPLHMLPIYNSTHLKLENSETLNAVGLNIPLHPSLSMTDIEFIIEKIKQFGRIH